MALRRNMTWRRGKKQEPPQGKAAQKKRGLNQQWKHAFAFHVD